MKKVIKVKQNPKNLLIILGTVLRSLMLKKNFNALGKTHKYFDMKKKVQHYAVHVYSGYQVNFSRAQSMYYLRIDCAKKIVNSQTALDVIDNCYKMFRHKDR